MINKVHKFQGGTVELIHQPLTMTYTVVVFLDGQIEGKLQMHPSPDSEVAEKCYDSLVRYLA